jgi:nucleoside-diphosphate-sugar epimerase
VRLVVTGATGFLGWRAATRLADRGHDVTAVARPGAAPRAHSHDLAAVAVDAGDPAIHELIAGQDAVLHFAGVPDPARARADPARAVRENAGTTLNLLDGCARHGAGLVYPSSIRAGVEPLPDAYAASKRLGEEVCRLHRAAAAVVRMTSVFGPGQVASEGATGAIAAFAGRALRGEPIVIPGDPRRTRDFLYVDDLLDGLERLVAERAWGELLLAAGGAATPLVDAAELVLAAVGSGVPLQLPGGELPVGEGASYAADPSVRRLGLTARPLAEGVSDYVDWLSRHPPPEGRPPA